MEYTYRRLLEDREINPKTDSIWAIQDVAKLWRKKTERLVLADGYHILEDGTVMPNNVDNETEETGA